MTAKDAGAEYVRETLLRCFDVTLRRIPESKKDGEKTADLELLDGGERKAVVEVKTIERTPRIAANGFSVRHGLTTRRDNSPGRVATLIHRAWGQLAAYPDDLAKVLVLVNDEEGANVIDLQEAVQGFLDYGNANTGRLRNVASQKIAEGRIRDERWRIDLYIWIDRCYDPQKCALVFPVGGVPYEETKTLGPYFRPTSTKGGELVRAYFGGERPPQPSAGELLAGGRNGPLLLPSHRTTGLVYGAPA